MVVPALLVLLTAVPAEASAQDESTVEFNWSTEARVFGANTLLGGLSAGVAALLRGDPFVPAFTRGSGGGAMIYAGKRLVVDSRSGAGLLGRQVASIGGSIIGNEVSGRGSLDRVAFAFGPVRAYVGHEVDGIDWRLDVVAVGAVVYGMTQGAHFDLGRSVSSGAIVIRGSEIGPLALPGTIFDNGSRGIISGTDRPDYVWAHEKVHILQYDQSFLSLGRPLEDWMGGQSPSLGSLFRHLEFNLPILATAAWVGLRVIPVHANQPWEKESIHLGRTR